MYIFQFPKTRFFFLFFHLSASQGCTIVPALLLFGFFFASPSGSRLLFHFFDFFLKTHATSLAIRDLPLPWLFFFS